MSIILLFPLMYIFSTKIVVGEVTSCQSDSSCFYLASHSAFRNTFISYCFIGIFYYARACANVWSYSSSSSLQKFCIQKFFMRSKQHFIFYHKSHSRRGFGVLFGATPLMSTTTTTTTSRLLVRSTFAPDTLDS